MDIAKKIKQEFWRKFIHIFFHLFLVFAINYWDRKTILIPYICVGVVFISLDVYRIFKANFLNKFLVNLFGQVVRPWEYKRLSAATYSLIGNFIVLITFNDLIFSLAALYIGLCDPIGWVVRQFGKKRFEYDGIKSLEGAVAFFISAIIITYTFSLIQPDLFEGESILWLSIVGGFVGSLTETIFIKQLEDNVSVPIMSAIGLWIVY